MQSSNTTAGGDERRVPIIIDGERYVAPKQELDGASLRRLPTTAISDQYDLWLEVEGGDDVLVDDDEAVTLRPQMVFTSLPKHINPGSVTAIAVPTAVVADLEAFGSDWEASGTPSGITVKVMDVSLPSGLAPRKVDVLVDLPGGFPDVGPDMFWTEPAITIDGVGPPAGCQGRRNYEGRVWQRWSRHIGVSWRPGVDSMSSYLRYIARCWAIEAAKARAVG